MYLIHDFAAHLGRSPPEKLVLQPIATPLDTAPLYQRVADRIANRIYDGHWRPGEPIPNEFALAEEFSVSQGTIRKAMSVVEETGLVDRQQGRGTFVRKLSEERSYYHFFRLAHPQGERVTPEPDEESVSIRVANEFEQKTFSLQPEDQMVVIKRLRCVSGTRATCEHILVPEHLFPGLVSTPETLPQALYPFYHQSFGIFVLRADEYISAIAADEQTAIDLKVELGSPTLQVNRTAFDMKDRAVEIRISRFRADLYQYNVNLS